MNRLKEAWFEFAGQRSDAMGIQLTKMPTRGMAAEKGTFQEVAGRSGAVWLPEDGFGTVEVRVECYVPDGKMDAIACWLTGAGLLRFSDEPDRAYDARIAKGFSRSNPLPRFSMQQFTVVFVCQPFRRLYPEAAAITVTASGTSIEQQGTAEAFPRVEIHGSGSFSMTIGMTTMFFTDISEGIVVDSELMDALDLSEAQLLNNSVSGDFFVLDPQGTCVLSWILDDGASISEVLITPRWRYY